MTKWTATDHFPLNLVAVDGHRTQWIHLRSKADVRLLWWHKRFLAFLLKCWASAVFWLTTKRASNRKGRESDQSANPVTGLRPVTSRRGQKHLRISWYRAWAPSRDLYIYVTSDVGESGVTWFGDGDLATTGASPVLDIQTVGWRERIVDGKSVGH